jgi:glycosyltransferase involved in cell wall biosynthesis
MRIAVLSNTTWYLYNFRLNLMLALQKAGYQVFAVGPEDDYVQKIKQYGIPHLPFNVSGDSTNIFGEAKTVFKLYRTIKHQKIDVVLSNTPKGNIYATLATLPLKSLVLPNVSGLGRSFIKKNLLTFLVKILYRFTFSFNQYVFFQNEDDKQLFLQTKLVSPKQPILLPGSGVDLKRFQPQKGVLKNNVFTFILAARILWDKGIGEYVEAAKQLKQKKPNARFMLLGQLDVANPATVPRETVMAWEKAGLIEYLGKTDNIIPYFAQADCVVLPSYREGTPRSLLEAAAMGKPIITTDAVGCRNTIDDNISGFLCKLKDAGDLADKMCRMMHLNQHEISQMGNAGRAKMEREFDERMVIQRYLSVIQNLTSGKKTP